MAATDPPPLTADECVELVHAALAARDFAAVEAALTVLAVRDPHRAAGLVDDLKTALAVASIVHGEE
jgi:hypothetical protein